MLMASGAPSPQMPYLATTCNPWPTTHQVSISKTWSPNRTFKPLLTVTRGRRATVGNLRRRPPQTFAQSGSKTRRRSPFSTILRAIHRSERAQSWRELDYGEEKRSCGGTAGLSAVAAPTLRLTHLTTIKHSFCFQNNNFLDSLPIW